MTAGLSTTRWRRTWRDRLPPRKQWPAWAASMACLALMFWLAAWPQ